MINFPQADYLSDYEKIVTQLESDPQNFDLKHKAVLALARMGSLDFARQEFGRYELDKVRHHEDILALNGRLSKDFYLVTSGSKARSHAQDAAEKYEAAFKDTQGYYSGVNAATMALLADMPWEIIKARIETVLNILPPTENLTPEKHYFIEATRAECFLLLGQISKAKDALRSAIDFDPLNYTAHASTLKQFTLILDKREGNKTWLTSFKPPRAAHFAGHLWKESEHVLQKFPEIISDSIQQNDIGFGYGALAAGADILFAEALLEEGAELNVILPSSIEIFESHSVKPYGENWSQRFHTCLDRANSIICLPNKNGTDLAYITLGARIAMGQTILRGRHLDVDPVQVLILDSERENSITQLHQRDWKEGGLETIEVPLDKKNKPEPVADTPLQNMSILLRDSNSSKLEKYDTLEAALEHIKHTAPDITALGFDLEGSEKELEGMMQHKVSEGILTSEALASYAALKLNNTYKVTFAGTMLSETETLMRTYTLRAIS